MKKETQNKLNALLVALIDELSKSEYDNELAEWFTDNVCANLKDGEDLLAQLKWIRKSKTYFGLQSRSLRNFKSVLKYAKENQ